MIEDYLRDFEAHLVGSPAQKSEWCAELRAHLEDAATHGDLDDAIERLGSPRAAAAAFRAGSSLALAGSRRRWAAAWIDHVPLIAVCIAIAIEGVASHKPFSLLLPPPPFFGSDYSLFRNVITALGLLWSYVALALIEARQGRTPGKALLALRTVAADGTNMTRPQAFRRRVPILFGPLVWIDVIAAKFTERQQRVFDLLASTVVIDDRPTSRSPRHHDDAAPTIGV